MSKYDSDDVDDPVLNTRLIVLLAAFACGAALDWFIFHPGRRHWSIVGVTFIGAITLEYLDGIRTRIKRIERKLNTILETLNKR